jgi:hypothetical protein
MDALVFTEATKLEPSGTLAAFQTSVSVPGSGATTFLNVTGAGWLSCVTLTNNAVFGTSFSLRITIDGGTPNTISPTSMEGFGSSVRLPGLVRFTTSLLIEVTNASTTNSATVSGAYILR